MYSCAGEARTTEERETMILEHLPQVRLIARRIHENLPERVTMDDLISSGTIGLIAAIDNFDPGLNVKLKTYAEYRIRGAILDTLRGLDWAPRQKRRMSRQIETAIASAEQRLGRAPVEEEIAAQLGISLAEYHGWLVDTEGLQIADLELAKDSDGNGTSLLKFVADQTGNSPAQILERSELERLVARAMERMPKVERTVLSLYYTEELTLREIAQVMDLHLSRISQLKTQAILRLRTFIESRWPGRREA
jgi:RNA polymerase sigma factor for flagellar operon FliA